ncbi:alanine--tRNA ligase [Hutsoniella sourekii]|uniref:alanine--tRNA ligase n=1 Tax=Hutsoniella sourekii TaxID=87650 RepID=UPI0004842E3E|nr:alanine--tRNA ligase [Hutsoniella sourekii]
MKELTSAQIRQKFLDFFQEKNHKVRPSASLIPVNDPTLLWINSGVATLKKYFDGTEVPDNPRITNSQKSIRTNDIENVGVTARHHTLFEMLGNFSIGDYFKEEAIHWAWEFLTDPKWLGFEPEKLYVTYYPEDLETKEIWESIPNFINDHLVIDEDNFWDIGAGPCGPNTEIYYDRGQAFNDLAEDDPESYPSGENERWLEIWNLVFSEFNHMPDDTYEPLPHKNIDTGMGLERLVSVIQETKTNFETDLFMPIIQAIEELTTIKYGQDPQLDVSFKVIADHIRAVSFAISDGALPSNEGRGYILRRLIRRSVMHGRKLGITDPFLSNLVPVVGCVMGSYYQELIDNTDFVQDIIAGEEARFHETIEGGEHQLKELIDELKSQNLQTIPGKDAFQLYDTYGFPLELTEEIALDNGFTVDQAGFETEMEAQRERARSARSNEDSMTVQSTVLQDIDTDYEFVGYHQLQVNASVVALVDQQEQVDRLDAHQEGWVFFNRSPFYAEKGGQVADIGGIYDGDDLVAEVLDVQQAPNGQAMHKVRTIDMPLNLNQSYTLEVNASARMKTQQNHTATHLLHQGLKTILGSHANQAGSYVGPDRLRFDFSHFGKVTSEELSQIEEYVNMWIANGADVITTEMPIDEAKAMGAQALFGEKYGDIVRVVNIANESIELCGGTHVSNTHDIGTFKLLHESGIGAGIRRIEALTGQAAIDYYRQQESLVHHIQEQLKVSQEDQIIARIQQLQADLKASQSQVESLSAKLIQSASGEIFDQVNEVDGITYIAAQLSDQGQENLRNLGDQWRQKAASNIFVVASSQEEKVSLLVFVDDETVKAGLKAGDIIKPLAKMVGGGGGGRPQMAQAGGKDPSKIGEMIQEVPEVISRLLEG